MADRYRFAEVSCCITREYPSHHQLHPVGRTPPDGTLVAGHMTISSSARPPAARLLLLLAVAFLQRCCMMQSHVMRIALLISGFAADVPTLQQFASMLTRNVLLNETKHHFEAFIWLQDGAMERMLKTLLLARRPTLPITLRADNLDALPSVFSEPEDDAIAREYALLPPSALLPGTFNTLRMLWKFAGVEMLRTLPTRSHDYVLRLRPDLVLFGRLDHLPPATVGIDDGPRNEGPSVLVPWTCPGSDLVFDQLQVMESRAAARLASLRLPGTFALLANRSIPPSSYPERMVFHALDARGIRPVVARFPSTALVLPGGQRVRDSFGKLRVDYAGCAPYPPPLATKHW